MRNLENNAGTGENRIDRCWKHCEKVDKMVRLIRKELKGGTKKLIAVSNCPENMTGDNDMEFFGDAIGACSKQGGAPCDIENAPLFSKRSGDNFDNFKKHSKKGRPDLNKKKQINHTIYNTTL